ncbi:MAG: 4Fe-4S cluster-binding domain-containing protein [Candidatus Aminicenantes bacterium]|nr:MAG: 4Fe-4S cluster-binding domain-containing protein [Candidatus Aminicenantes bacterium]
MAKKAKNPQPIAGVNYPGFEGLSRLDAVKIRSGHPLTTQIFETDESLMIHLTITGRCYARCKGCVNSAITMGSDRPRNAIVSSQEVEPDRDTAIIRELADRHRDQSITICFYGGEPFLAADKMERTWRILKESEAADRFRFLVYTNGELLSDALNIYPEFMKEMWLYSVSIDGDEEQHNRVRQGTRLSRIKENLRELSTFYKGNVLCWSTLREEQSLLNCFEEFMRLYQEGLVNHFFWHWAENREPFENLHSYVVNYGQDLEKIMDIYVQKISKGILLPIAHVNELILFLLAAKERGHTACGVELAKNYDIVSGKIYPCADLPSCLSIGGLDKDRKLQLSEYDLDSLVEYKSWLGCYQCGVHFYCGGRCPVQVVAGSKERTYQYCQLMRLHVGIIQDRISDILRGLERNGITLQTLYDQSAFLADYTDVVP